MSFVSLTQAAQALGIDPKTLRRWLTQGQVPVLSHPSDARLKGLNESALHELARQHGRQVSRASTPNLPLPQRWADGSTVPQEVLDQLAQLHEHLLTVQQHLAVLTQRLEPAVPVQSPSPVRRQPAPKPAPKPPQAPRTPKTAGVLARVEYVKEGHYVIICPTHGVLPFEPDSQEWVGWLASQTAFRFVGQHGRLTAHREVDRLHPRPWRAHRRIRNHTHNLPLAHSADLTLAVLEQAAASLQALLS